MNSGPIDGNPASALKLTKSRVHALPRGPHAVRHFLLSQASFEHITTGCLPLDHK